MASKKDSDKPQAVIEFPQSKAERTKLQNKAAFGDKIRALRTAKGMTQPQLAELLGVTKNAVTNWEAGVSRPDLASIPPLCAHLGISADTFFGIPHKDESLSKSEREHMQRYRTLTRYQQRSVDALMIAMIENDEQALRDEYEAAFAYISRTELRASAGTGTPLTDEYEQEKVFLRTSRNVCKADTVITVSGDSMLPTFHDGDDLLVEYTDQLAPGEIGIFIVAGEGYVKEYQPDGLHSHNPRYKTIRPVQDDNFRCVGRVLDVVTPDMLPNERELSILNEIYSEKK